jgi:hypothetical protein
MSATHDFCTLQHAVGRSERCPGSGCPFWADEGCALDGIRSDLETNPELAGYLLDLRASAAGVVGWNPFRRLARHPEQSPASNAE